MDELERYRGAILGLATGDALGTTLEFTEPPCEPLDDIVGGGPFALDHDEMVVEDAIRRHVGPAGAIGPIDRSATRERVLLGAGLFRAACVTQRQHQIATGTRAQVRCGGAYDQCLVEAGVIER